MKIPRLFLIAFLIAAFVPPCPAQKVDGQLLKELHWRMIGPHRGGRTVGVAGVPGSPNVFYIGVNNGGVWRTSDYGHTWVPVFDDQPTGSIGALGVAPSDPRVIYVGSGEGLQRPDLSVGDGMFRSTDEGATWRHLGLGDAQQIGAVIVDPRDKDRVLVAVLGHPYGPNEERGVFRSTDGGGAWQKVLYRDENTGAIALAFDPRNPDIVYADLWSARQGPWENGSWEGKTSGLFKSLDGGTTWHQLTGGLPTGDEGLGRIGFAVAPNDPSRMFAMVEAPRLGGVYRSDDAGEHWVRVNSEDRIWGRGDDFAEVKVHPGNKDIIFVANTSLYRSVDGGANFSAIKGEPGGDDYHTIWINPDHPDIMLVASDQGAAVTVNAGQTWSSWYNQPTAQFYHVAVDNEFPYNVYSGQQESGSVGIASRGNDGVIGFREWHPVGADEYAYVAPDPLHPDIVYGGKLSRYDKRTGQVQSVAPEAIRSGKYRFLRTSPLLFSPVEPQALYLGSNVVFRTTDGGNSWAIISPDLTREAPEVPASIGIFRTKEMAKQPRRGVVYALAPSPLDAGLLWAGTDDGYVHVTKDGGKLWKNVTPEGVTAWSKVAGMDAGHFDAGTAYAAVNRIRLDDMRPHIYRTRNGGGSWQEIVSGLPASGPVNAVREDPVRKGLLFAGTERAVYASFDDGEHWQQFRLNMPATSIRDLVVHADDIVVATHGRSFWILDDIAPLRQLTDGVLGSDAFLFKPAVAFRVRWNQNTDTPIPPEEPAGENPPEGAMIDYFLGRDAAECTLAIYDQAHELVRSFSSRDVPPAVDERALRIAPDWIRPEQRLPGSAGLHRFVWDLHYPGPEDFGRGYPMAAVRHNTPAHPLGPWVHPGDYTVILKAGEKTCTQTLTVRMDPRVRTPEAILRQQSDLSMACYRGMQSLHDAMAQVRTLRDAAHAVAETVKAGALKDSLAALEKKLQTLEGSRSAEDDDIIFFDVEPGRTVRETLSGLRSKLMYLMSVLQGADAEPTVNQREAVRDEERMLAAALDRWKKFGETGLERINRELRKAGLEPLKAH